MILSPGVPLTHPAPHRIVDLAASAGCEVIGDVELLAREALPNRIAAITGTNGKSTTTALLGFLLESCGLDVAVGGNLGTPVLALPKLAADGIYVIEMSSYQIDLAPSLRPDVAVLLNLSPDHIDRHGDMAGYVGVKRTMLERQTPDQIAVVGVDDTESAGIYEKLAAARGTKIVPVSVGPNPDNRAKEGGIWVTDGILRAASIDDGEPLVDLTGARNLVGKHNWQNAGAALAASVALGCPAEHAAACLLRFPGLAHRMEDVGNIGGVRFINDSKATNAEATARALACFDHIIWIVGGRAKEGGIESLRRYFAQVDHAYLIGEAAQEFAQSLGDGVALTFAENLDTAVTQAAAQAAQRAENGDQPVNTVVLLSPAAASFDQFSDFEARGDRFRELVQNHAVLHADKPVAGGQA